MLTAEIKEVLDQLEKYEAEGEGDGIDAYREHATELLYKVRELVEHYEFLATHVAYMQVDFDWGGRDKIYNDRKSFNDFVQQVRDSIKMNKP